MSLVLKHSGQPVSIQYVKSVIDSIGPRAFIKLNPWATELIDATPKAVTPRMACLDEADSVMGRYRDAEAMWVRETIKDLQFKGWKNDDINAFILGTAKLVRRARQDREKVEDSALINYHPNEVASNPARILDKMFKFGAKPKVRHYDSKKKLT